MEPASSETATGAAGSEFGWTRLNPDGSAKYHDGFDWAAPVGTDVMAPADATVSYGYDTKNDGGYYVRMDLGNGATVNVGHLQPPADGSTEGRRGVKAGAVVGHVGTSGNSEGSKRQPHGHVLTRVHGTACNPRDFVSKTGGGGSCQ